MALLTQIISVNGWVIFFIRNVAKCAARMGRSFSSSTETLHIYGHEIGIIPDIQVRNGDRTYNFSDGIRKLSLPLAKHVSLKCGCEKNSKRIPSAFQIKYGGYKGVVAVDPTSFDKLSLHNLNYPEKTGT
jgi:RNA-dependent RNA polymerase